jgi:hypothetical protein
MIQPLPKATPYGEIDLATHSLTGWPKTGTCEHDGGRLNLLVATQDHASYECMKCLVVQRFDRDPVETSEEVL